MSHEFKGQFIHRTFLDVGTFKILNKKGIISENYF